MTLNFSADSPAFAGPLMPLPARGTSRASITRRPAEQLCLSRGRAGGVGHGGSSGRGDAHWRGPPRRDPGRGGGAGGGGGGSGCDGVGGGVGGIGFHGAGAGRAGEDPHGPGAAPAALAAVLRDAGRELASLAPDVRAAVVDGRVTPDVLRSVLCVESWPLVGALVRLWPALRNRLVANNRFPMQLGVELSVGVITKTLAEVSMRGERFWKEFDLYTSDLALEVVGDAMLVWLLSPAAMFAAASRANSLSGFFRCLPKHVTQVGSYTASQRATAFLFKGSQFALVGFLSSVLGHGMTTVLVNRRKAHEARLYPTRRISDDKDVELAPILPTSVAWGGFMFCSSNPRYQLVNALEQRLIFPLLDGRPVLSAGVTFGLRFFNCFVGGVHWIPFARFFGVQ